MGQNTISAVSIDWNENIGNDPDFIVYMNMAEDQFKYDERKTRTGTAYLALHNDRAKFCVHNPHNETGYGGTEFTLPMLDGTTRTIKGPWSSNARDISWLFDIDLTDVTIVDVKNRYRYAGAVKTEPLIAACQKIEIDLGFVRPHRDCKRLEIQPLLNGKPKNNHATLVGRL